MAKTERIIVTTISSQKKKVEWYHTEFFYFPCLHYHFSEKKDLVAKEEVGMSRYLFIYAVGLIVFFLALHFMGSDKEALPYFFILKIVLSFTLFFFLIAKIYLYKIDQEVRRKFNWYSRSDVLS